MQKEILSRRQKFTDKMQPNSVAIFFSAPEVIRNQDNYYPYRQNSDFWYLTGYDEPESALLLIKDKNHQVTSILFNRIKDKLAETWTGFRLGQEAALSTVQVNKAYAFNDMPAKLIEIVFGKDILYHANLLYSYADKIINDLINPHQEETGFSPLILDWRPLLHELRLFKSPKEIGLLAKAGEISAKGHIRAMQACQPGLSEYHLESEILYEFGQHGARKTAYNTIVGSGANGCTLHYEINNDQLKNGELVLIDAGCEYHYYAGDVTRTFPINGKFTRAQRDIYDIVLAAQLYAIKHLGPGTTINSINRDVVRIKLEGLLKLGIVKGNIDELIANNAILPFYMHTLGHCLGLDVHDVDDHIKSNADRPLEPGMVLTVEPGLYINEQLDVPAIYKNIGIRIEDNIVITEQGNEVLTWKAPKHPDEIETLMAKIARNSE